VAGFYQNIERTALQSGLSFHLKNGKIKTCQHKLNICSRNSSKDSCNYMDSVSRGFTFTVPMRAAIFKQAQTWMCWWYSAILNAPHWKSDAPANLSLEYLITISPVFIRGQDWRLADKPLLRNIRTEGMAV
jgi:hypothetical protein